MPELSLKAAGDVLDPTFHSNAIEEFTAIAQWHHDVRVIDIFKRLDDLNYVRMACHEIRGRNGGCGIKKRQNDAVQTCGCVSNISNAGSLEHLTSNGPTF